MCPEEGGAKSKPEVSWRKRWTQHHLPTKDSKRVGAKLSPDRGAKKADNKDRGAAIKAMQSVQNFVLSVLSTVVLEARAL